MNFTGNNTYLDFRTDILDKWKDHFGGIEVKWNGISTDVLDMLLKCGINPTSYNKEMHTLHCIDLIDSAMIDITHDEHSSIANAICDWCVTYGQSHEAAFMKCIHKLDPKTGNKKSIKDDEYMIRKINKVPIDTKINKNNYNKKINSSSSNDILNKFNKEYPNTSDFINKNIKYASELFDEVNKIKITQKKDPEYHKAENDLDGKYYIIRYLDVKNNTSNNRRVAIAIKQSDYFELLFSRIPYKIPLNKIISAEIISEYMYSFIEMMINIINDENANYDCDDCCSCCDYNAFCDECRCSIEEDNLDEEFDPIEELISTIRNAKKVTIVIVDNEDGNK